MEEIPPATTAFPFFLSPKAKRLQNPERRLGTLLAHRVHPHGRNPRPREREKAPASDGVRNRLRRARLLRYAASDRGARERADELACARAAAVDEHAPVADARRA